MPTTTTSKGNKTMRTIAEIELELQEVRAAEDAKLAAAADARAREMEAKQVDALAADAARFREWWAKEKQTRIKCYVPPSLHLTHVELGAMGRRWRDHRGMHSGPETLRVEQD